ncbi:hypothetical protein GCM10007147_12960 [Nocardiopsis kunsanensis]|uniref:Uncharacterized protein n=1 Tax=Nocardiopsis kunsanensis TaxID=141693 RepID=A0A918XAW3_9ACTN|nr:hypothetical protein GCM10007147_12960 [Nocardiopsis kunsanensis]
MPDGRAVWSDMRDPVGGHAHRFWRATQEHITVRGAHVPEHPCSGKSHTAAGHFRHRADHTDKGLLDSKR